MGSNSFGNIFKITTWGESHGKAVGVVIDGCPAGLELSEEEMRQELARRSPNKNPYTSPRKEEDKAEIMSGIFEGKTTGTPISIVIPNKDVDSEKYESTKELWRPGHAHFTYLKKYGIFDYRGGGRSSARETVCRVAAGYVAKKLLRHFDVDLVAYLKEVGGIGVTDIDLTHFNEFKEKVFKSSLFCPDLKAEGLIEKKLEEIKKEGDSIGGIVEMIAISLPLGLGDPMYEKLEANLAKAMMTLPASKGVEIGSGFQAAKMKGSEHNDPFVVGENGEIVTRTNHAGGILGGISTGMPLLLRVAFKPTSSIKKAQETVDMQGNRKEFQLPEGSRHDLCVSLRAVPVVEAMGALVLADALLMNRSCRL